MPEAFIDESCVQLLKNAENWKEKAHTNRDLHVYTEGLHILNWRGRAQRELRGEEPKIRAWEKTLSHEGGGRTGPAHEQKSSHACLLQQRPWLNRSPKIKTRAALNMPRSSARTRDSQRNVVLSFSWLGAPCGPLICHLHKSAFCRPILSSLVQKLHRRVSACTLVHGCLPLRTEWPPSNGPYLNSPENPPTSHSWFQFWRDALIIFVDNFGESAQSLQACTSMERWDLWSYLYSTWHPPPPTRFLAHT